MVRNEAFRLVEILARRRYWTLPLDEDEVATVTDTLADYWDEFDEIVLDADARSAHYFLYDHDAGSVTQILHDPDGIDAEKLAWVKDLKGNRRGRIEEYVKEFKGAEFHAGERPWDVPCDLAVPCATQNELNGEEAKTLVQNGCIGVSEGANMPTDLDGVHAFKEAKILFAPGKAANAGGVATSGLEMTQNSLRTSWTREEVDGRLQKIMKAVHQACRDTADHFGDPGNYVMGANIAGFVKVADAMLDQGLV